MKTNINEEDLKNEILISSSLIEITKKLKISPLRVIKFIKDNNLDISHFKSQKYKKEKENIINSKIGKWIVTNEYIIKKVGNRNRNKKFWKCICECGVGKYVIEENLLTGLSNQCTSCAATKPFIDLIPDALWNRIIGYTKKRKDRGISINKKDAEKLFLKQQGKCSLSGLEIVFPKTLKDFRLGNYTASLDRIDSSIGYEINNIQWVHRKINLMKNIFSMKEFLELCELITKNNKEKIKNE